MRAISVIAGYLALTLIAFYATMAVAGALKIDPRVGLWSVSTLFATGVVAAAIKRRRGGEEKENYSELKFGYGAVAFALISYKFPDIVAFGERALQY